MEKRNDALWCAHRLLLLQRQKQWSKGYPPRQLYLTNAMVFLGSPLPRQWFCSETGWVDSTLSAVYRHRMFWNYVLQDWEYASKYWNQVFAHLGSVWLCTKETWDMPCVGNAYTIVLPNVGHRGNLGWNWILCTRTFQVSSDTHCVHNRFTQGQSQRKPGVKLNIMCVLCTLNAHILGRASEMHNNFTRGRSQRMMWTRSRFWYALRTQ